MATVAKSNLGRGGVDALTFTTLTGTDDFVFDPLRTEILIMQNTTGSDVTVTIDGSGGTTENCPGIGPIDVSGGIQLTVTANGSETIQLGTIRAYLQGDIALTGGTGVEAAILVI